MNSRLLILLLGFFLLGFAGAGPPAHKAADYQLPVPEVRRDEKVPSLKEVVGHAWGEDVSSCSEVERYLRALVAYYTLLDLASLRGKFEHLPVTEEAARDFSPAAAFPEGTARVSHSLHCMVNLYVDVDNGVRPVYRPGKARELRR